MNDPDLERLFRAENVRPSADLLQRIEAQITRESRRIRLWATAGVLTLMVALAVTVPWLVDFADGLVASLDPAAGDFESAITSPGAIRVTLLALAFAAPWLWLKKTRI